MTGIQMPSGLPNSTGSLWDFSRFKRNEVREANAIAVQARTSCCVAKERAAPQAAVLPVSRAAIFTEREEKNKKLGGCIQCVELPSAWFVVWLLFWRGGVPDRLMNIKKMSQTTGIRRCQINAKPKIVLV
jgi:hypothetical protein